MFKRNLWKLTLSLAIVLWAVVQLVPFQDRDFPAYIGGEATAKKAEFNVLLREAEARKTTGQAPSVFVALKQISKERNLDLAKEFFPNLNLGDVKNPERRNKLLLDHLLKESKGRVQLGLDLRGGVAFTLEVDEKALADVPSEARPEKLSKAIEIISTRINGLGVSEPVIRAVGDNRIEVQLPGVNTKDNPEVLDSVKKPARLDFRLVMQGTSAMAQPPGDVPPGYEVLSEENESKTGEMSVAYYLVKRIPEMSGQALERAGYRMDEFGRFSIHIDFNDEGTKQFAALTTANPGRLMAIVLDGRLSSAPRINEPITSGNCEITSPGGFSRLDAENLATVLNNPLDLPLQIKEQYEVGPTLAGDAVASARLSFIISTLLTIGFVCFFYTIGGLIAAIGMGINVIVTLAVLSTIGATLSMPGIAGIVLTLAMSVDSNILIFERMREELKLGKSLPSALEAGFDKAWSAIIDSNVTTLIVAAIMIWLGTGPVKGFGITLAIGIFTTMFAAVVVSRLLMDALILPGTIKKLRMFSVLQNTNFDFLKFARPSFITSWAIVLIGIGVIVYKGAAIYGIDFVGGDTVTLGYTKKIEPAALLKAADAAGLNDTSFSYQRQLGGDTAEVLKATARFDQGAPLVAKLQQAFPEAGFTSLGETRIGPSVGEEIRWNAFLSVGLSLVGILLYVAFRFEFGYGLGAVVSTVHDVLMTIGLFVLFDRQFNASMVAAILLIVGYSINDTIVVFDRIREELALNPTARLRDIINRALNLTLSRTIITGGTTLLTALTLLIVTTGEVNDIAFTLLIGVITGTFSSLFIASPIFYWWHKGDRKHVEKHQDVKPTYEWTGASKASQ